MRQSGHQLTHFRLKILTNLIPFFFVLILIRLFYWQIIRGPQLSAQASREHSSVNVLRARRGNIYDSRGILLAGTSNLFHLYLYKPQMTHSNQEIVDKLAPILAPPPPPASEGAKPISPQEMVETTKNFINSRVTLSSNWISIKHYLTPDQKKAIDNLDFDGLGFDPEFLRYYPESSLSAHVLGFVGKDLAGQEQGYFGLEGYFDRQLQGRSGKVRSEKDAYGNPILIGNYRLLQSQNGESLTTTLDKSQQFLAETLLRKGIKKYGAKSGTVTVMETSTGKIRVLASFPNYDPSKYSEFNKTYYKNPVVASLFEPGSVIKPIIMASALDKKVIQTDTVCDICASPVQIGRFTIKTWNDTYHPNSSMTEILINSDNVGMVFVARKLGKENFLSTLKEFNFDKATNIEQQEEVSGGFKQGSNFREIDLATNSFGQGIAITRIQLLSAFNVLANNGLFVHPKLIEKIGNQVSKPETQTRILSDTTTQTITQMLIEVVDKGASKWAKPKSIVVAGKTGTAQIPVNGKYHPDKTITSFIGYFPAHNPKYTMLVTLTEPQTSPWGSETSAPLWFQIANQLLLSRQTL